MLKKKKTVNGSKVPTVNWKRSEVQSCYSFAYRHWWVYQRGETLVWVKSDWGWRRNTSRSGEQIFQSFFPISESMSLSPNLVWGSARHKWCIALNVWGHPLFVICICDQDNKRITGSASLLPSMEKTAFTQLVPGPSCSNQSNWLGMKEPRRCWD